MPYKIIENKLTQIRETGSYQKVDTTYLDAKEQEVPIKVQVPIITFEEVSPDPVGQVVENIKHDLETLKAEANAIIERYNAKMQEVEKIATDLPDIGLPVAKAVNLIG